jgi:hypothetical protein
MLGVSRLPDAPSQVERRAARVAKFRTRRRPGKISICWMRAMIFFSSAVTRDSFKAAAEFLFVLFALLFSLSKCCCRCSHYRANNWIRQKMMAAIVMRAAALLLLQHEIRRERLREPRRAPHLAKIDSLFLLMVRRDGERGQSAEFSFSTALWRIQKSRPREKMSLRELICGLLRATLLIRQHKKNGFWERDKIIARFWRLVIFLIAKCSSEKSSVCVCVCV